MDDTPEVIRQQMEETKSQLSEKLESLEHQVSETVQSTGEILIYIDAASGMMVKQEFTASKGLTDADSPMSYVYEIRNLNMDVDDSVFDIPQGFKKTGWANGTPPLARN